LSLKLLLTTRDEIQAVFDFLRDSEIVRRNWISNWFYISIWSISYLLLVKILTFINFSLLHC
jgi:hypothetical protein